MGHGDELVLADAHFPPPKRSAAGCCGPMACASPICSMGSCRCSRSIRTRRIAAIAWEIQSSSDAAA